MTTSAFATRPVDKGLWYEIQVVPDDPIVADRTRATLLRQRFLDTVELEFDKPTVIDLNWINVLTLSAADELIVRWIERARTPRRPIVAAFATYQVDVKATLDAALRAAQQSAYVVKSRPSPNDIPEIIGDATPTQRQTVQELARLGIATARQFGDARNQAANAATNRLTDVVARGLVSRRDDDGVAVFVYPFAEAVTVPHQARSR